MRWSGPAVAGQCRGQSCMQVEPVVPGKGNHTDSFCLPRRLGWRLSPELLFGGWGKACPRGRVGFCHVVQGTKNVATLGWQHANSTYGSFHLQSSNANQSVLLGVSEFSPSPSSATITPLESPCRLHEVSGCAAVAGNSLHSVQQSSRSHRPADQLPVVRRQQPARRLERSR